MDVSRWSVSMESITNDRERLGKARHCLRVAIGADGYDFCIWQTNFSHIHKHGGVLAQCDPRANQCRLGRGSGAWSQGWQESKLNDDQVKQIKALLKYQDIKVTDTARHYGVCRTTIFNPVGPVKPERTQA